MRKIALLLALLPVLALAQFNPPPNPGSGSTVAFYAAGLSSQLSASTSSARVILSVAPATAGQVQVFNSTTAIAFVACGGSTITAAVGSAGTATSSYPIAPGSVVVITPQVGAAYCAAILSTSTGAVYFTPGSGL